MKKHLMLLTLVLTATVASAQGQFFSTKEMVHEFRYGVRGGMTVNTMNFSGDYQLGGTRVAFRVGGVVEMPWYESLSFQAGLFYTSKGFRYSDELNTTFYSFTESERADPYFLEITPQVSYRWCINPKWRLQIDAGPFFAVGLHGKWRHQYADANETVNTCTNVFSKGGLKRFDAGLAVGVGATYGNYYFGINYDWGWVNLSRYHRNYRDTKAPVEARSRSFSVNVGYNF
ncbi:MAG: PorT family protein [Alloprevotella sp.]|nr:PorT family protein [Alloprevotella sp.]